MTDDTFIKLDSIPIPTKEYSNGWLWELTPWTRLRFPGGRVITLTEINRLLTAWDGWDTINCTFDDDTPTEAEYLEYAEAQAAADAARADTHASDCRVWVGEICDCVMGRIEL